MPKQNNPIVRAIELGRATPQEEFDAMVLLMERNAQQDDPITLKKKTALVALSETVEGAQKLLVEGDTIIGLSTGYDSIDKMTKGIGPSEIVVLFGDTSHGKSQLAQNITLNLAAKAIPVLFVGLEMSNSENTARFITMKGEGAESLPILYPQSSDLGYKDIDGLVEKAKQEGAQLVVIDHLHMFARDVNNLANEISLICHEFKRVARKYELPMIVISHINRMGTGKGIPELRDLKGSGSIEQDCDIALAVWRDMNVEEEHQVLKVVLRKNRLRGRKQRVAELAILENARLAEQLVTAFPTVR